MNATAINRWGQVAVNEASLSAYLLTPIVNVSLTSSPNPSVTGQAVTFKAKATSIGGPPPNGDFVTFQAGSVLLGKAPIIGGVATFSTASLLKGNHAIHATYAGGAIYAPSKFAALVQAVN